MLGMVGVCDCNPRAEEAESEGPEVHWPARLALGWGWAEVLLRGIRSLW